ncbi:MAG TPA: formamidopyrimidine-DNA glycosylase [Blastocatellia bacterium]|nr:formamidopyrimidine-DNA glycosylase [Blastocatellia bacterium]
MPELPDIVVYLEALQQRILSQTLERVQITSPFLLRTAAPPITSVAGRKVVELRRLGKRICIGLEDDLWLALHLMIAGRLHWKEVTRPARTSARGQTKPSKFGLAIFQFASGTLSLTEAGTQRRASLHLVQSENELQRFDAGGLEVFATNPKSFGERLQSANHTLKRALTDPRLFSGIGNAYSDEILWQAQLSPIAMTQKLKAEEIEKLFNATRESLTKWTDILRAEVGDKFPEKVTAFRPEMAVHGKYGEACVRCGNKVQRIRYASNETNYCPTCQTGGRLLADRALSRLLRADWPRTAEELEDVKRD